MSVHVEVIWDLADDIDCPTNLNESMPAIVVQLAGVTSVFHDRFVIGTRTDCDLVLYDQDASPLHALVTPGESGWQVEDMGSLRGVRVNGRLRATARLQKGDRVRLGSTTLVMVPICVLSLKASVS